MVHKHIEKREENNAFCVYGLGSVVASIYYTTFINQSELSTARQGGGGGNKKNESVS